jgi:hypothetical protein
MVVRGVKRILSGVIRLWKLAVLLPLVLRLLQPLQVSFPLLFQLPLLALLHLVLPNQGLWRTSVDSLVLAEVANPDILGFRRMPFVFELSFIATGIGRRQTIFSSA